jgi:hypothetical protein
MLKNKLYTEILQEFDEAKTRADKIAVLREYGHERFREFLRYCFDPQIEFDVVLPEKYRPAPEPAGLNYSYLHIEVPKLYKFIKNHPKRPAGYTGKKQTQDILVLLESLHKDEAILLVKMIKKDLSIKFLTEKILEEAYGK